MSLTKKIAVAIFFIFVSGIFAQKMAIRNKTNLAVFESDGTLLAVKILQDSRCGIVEFKKAGGSEYEFGKGFVARIKSDGSFASPRGGVFSPAEYGLLETLAENAARTSDEANSKNAEIEKYEANAESEEIAEEKEPSRASETEEKEEPAEVSETEKSAEGEQTAEAEKPAEDDSPSNERKWTYSDGIFPRLSFWLKEKQVFGVGM